MRLGLFDPPAQVPFSKIGMSEVSSPQHRALALEAAEKSIVLLKNDHNTLPLNKAMKTLAVVGPAADDPDAMLGNYYGTPSRIVTPLAGIQEAFGQKAKVVSATGSLYAPGSTTLIPSSALTAPGGQHGVLAEYFNNDALEGTPVLTRVEPRGYFVYEMRNRAVIRVLPNPTFSVRWSTRLQLEHAGDYGLGVARQECDSCLGTNKWRLTLDGKELINETRRAYSGHMTLKAKAHLEAGHPYELKIEYLQTKGGAGVELVWAPPADVLLQDAVTAANSAEAVVVCMGLNSRLEGEESPIEIPGFSHGDRTNIDVPEPQAKLLDALLATGKPVVVVLLNGSALAIRTAKEKAAAILETWYGGQEGGLAIARTLMGLSNPGGRLPVTFYESAEQLPDFSDYSMKGRTYRYFTGSTLFPFGYGLSYSRFQYSDLQVERNGNDVVVTATVKNTSSKDGDEVAQLYWANSATPNKELKGFKRLHVAAGKSERVRFVVPRTEVHGQELSLGGGQPSGETLQTRWTD
jgi:beta-glucosidase